MRGFILKMKNKAKKSKKVIKVKKVKKVKKVNKVGWGKMYKSTQYILTKHMAFNKLGNILNLMMITEGLNLYEARSSFVDDIEIGYRESYKQKFNRNVKDSILLRGLLRNNGDNDFTLTLWFKNLKTKKTQFYSLPLVKGESDIEDVYGFELVKSANSLSPGKLKLNKSIKMYKIKTPLDVDVEFFNSDFDHTKDNSERYPETKWCKC